MYQNTILIGNLGRDPELRYTQAGTAVCTLNLATNHAYKNAAGEQIKETTWWRVSVFGKTAENCAQYLKKGRLCLCEGRVRPDPNTGSPRLWQKQDGTWAASFEFLATTVKFMPGGSGEGGPAPVAEDIPGAPETQGDEDIPF